MNIMIVGGGFNLTIIMKSLSNASGVSTYQSTTLGKGLPYVPILLGVEIISRMLLDWRVQHSNHRKSCIASCL